MLLFNSRFHNKNQNKFIAFHNNGITELQNLHEETMSINKELLLQKFKEIGSSVVFEEPGFNRRRIRDLPVSIDVRNNAKGLEEFRIELDNDRDFDLFVLDHRPDERHLLLMLKTQDEVIQRRDGSIIKQAVDKIRFLCGHDERHYFACGIPDRAKVSTVEEAQLALKPETVMRSERRAGVKHKHLTRRKTKGVVRQGEWFFVPRPGFEPKSAHPVRRYEPLSRGRGSKPHIADEACTFGGKSVYVHEQLAPTGVDEAKMREILRREVQQGRAEPNFTVRTRDARVFVRGHIRHPDHKTVHLPYWHEVFMNTESLSKAAKAVVFLD